LEIIQLLLKFINIYIVCSKICFIGFCIIPYWSEEKLEFDEL